MQTIDSLVNMSDTALAASVNGPPVVEPLGGPIDVDDLMGRFPEAVYQHGRGTHLYNFLEALCGDAGAGMLKKQAYAARLALEAETITFSNLDSFYGDHFRFRRLKSEIYEYDGGSDYLEDEIWDEIRKKDNAYKARVQTFINATKLGNSPEGMELAAESAIGSDVEIIENYHYVLDQFSDDPLGLEPQGETASTNEFVVRPRLIKDDGTLDESVGYSAAIARQATYNTPIPSSEDRDGLTRAELLTDLSQLAATFEWVVAAGYDDEAYRFTLPELERNMVDIMDRLRPVGAFMSFYMKQRRFIPVETNDVAFATSERFQLQRFVNGTAAVNWPDPDNEQGMFIVAGVENQQKHADNAREWPVIFQNIENIVAYNHEALSDPDYNTRYFFKKANGKTGNHIKYLSRHSGPYLKLLTALFAPLRNTPTELIFAPYRAIAFQNTPLIMEARPR